MNYRLLVQVISNGHAMPVQPGTIARLKSATRTILLQGPTGGPDQAYFWIDLNGVPPGKYIVSVLFSQVDQLRNFEVVVHLGGQIAHDPEAHFQLPFPAHSPPLAGRTELWYPSSFNGDCFVALDCPQEHVTSILDGKLWAGDRPLAPAGDGYFRATLPPGRYNLRLEHARYALPPGTEPLTVSSTLVTRRVAVTPIAPPVAKLEIRGARFYGEIGQVLEFQTNLPANLAPQVQWQSSDASILRQEPTPNQFRGTARGGVRVTASYRGLQGSTSVTVRQDVRESVLREPDPAQVVEDPWSGGRVVAGEVLCGFKPGIAPAEQLKLIEQFGLTRAGTIPEEGIWQLLYDTEASSLKSLVERLISDPSVAFASPHAAFRWSSLAPYYPKEHNPMMPFRFWHLVKTEAFAAFALLEKIIRDPQQIAFCESGIWVSGTGAFHKDFTGRVSIPLSRYFSWGMLTEVKNPADLQDGDQEFHGTQITGIAAAGWNNDGAMGIDPKAGIVMVRCPAYGAFHIRALSHVASKVVPASRVVNNTLVLTSKIASLYNGSYEKRVKAIIDAGGLFVTSAGNFNKRVADCAVASIKAQFKGQPKYLDAILVVGATAIDGSDAHGPEKRWLDVQGGSDYDAAAADAMIDVSAPGDTVTGSGPNDDIMAGSGTSQAAPIVSGLAALLFSILPKAAASAIKKIIVDTTDPIVPVLQGIPKPPPRLRTEGDHLIGSGRVNVWQAVLFALNGREAESPGKVLFVGLRVTSGDEEGLKLLLEYSGSPAFAEVIEEKSKRNRPEGTDATLVTITNLEGAELPKYLLGERKQADGSMKLVYRRRLYLDKKSIAALSPRYVITCRMYAKGIVELRREERESSVPNRARLRIENLGTPPQDIEMLDPHARSPQDKSLQPWMKLAAGDAFGLTYRVVEGAAGVRIGFLDGALKPVPPKPVGDETYPYVTVPFVPGMKIQYFYVEAQFSSDAMEEALVDVEIFSLNNEMVRAHERVYLRSYESPSPELVNAPGWLFHTGWLVSPPQGGGGLSIGSVCEPVTWTCSAGVAPNLRKPFDGGGIIVIPVEVKFSSPPNEPAGKTGKCLVDVLFGTTRKRYGVRGRLEMPRVEFSCDQPHCSEIEHLVAQHAVVAKYEVKVTNHSPYDVYLKGFQAADELFPAHAPPVAVAPLKLSFRPGGNAAPVTEMRLASKGQAAGTLWIYYRDSVINLPANAIGRRRVKLALLDPSRPPAEMETAPKYWSTELEVTTVLRPKPEGWRLSE